MFSTHKRAPCTRIWTLGTLNFQIFPAADSPSYWLVLTAHSAFLSVGKFDFYLLPETDDTSFGPCLPLVSGSTIWTSDSSWTSRLTYIQSLNCPGTEESVAVLARALHCNNFYTWTTKIPLVIFFVLMHSRPCALTISDFGAVVAQLYDCIIFVGIYKLYWWLFVSCRKTPKRRCLWRCSNLVFKLL